MWLPFNIRGSLVLIFAVLFLFKTAVVVDAQTAVLESVTLSKSSVPSWCPVASTPAGLCSKEEGRIEVTSVVNNPNKERVGLIYIVTGGEIIGTGTSVIWDLHKARPGKYSITVGLGDGTIVRGRTITNSVVNEQCPVCTLPCECPILTARGPNAPVAAGDAFIVEADVRGGQVPDPKYLWTVSEGIVIEGQGTWRVLIRTDTKSTAKFVEVKKEIDGAGLCVECRSTVSLKVTTVPTKP